MLFECCLRGVASPPSAGRVMGENPRCSCGNHVSSFSLTAARRTRSADLMVDDIGDNVSCSLLTLPMKRSGCPVSVRHPRGGNYRQPGGPGGWWWWCWGNIPGMGKNRGRQAGRAERWEIWDSVSLSLSAALAAPEDQLQLRLVSKRCPDPVPSFGLSSIHRAPPPPTCPSFPALLLRSLRYMQSQRQRQKQDDFWAPLSK